PERECKMGKEYEIAFNWQAGDFQPVEIRARLLVAEKAGRFVPTRFARAEFTADPADVVELESRLEDQTAIAVVRLADLFYSDPNFNTRIKKPVTVTLTGTPEDSEAKPVVEKCLVTIRDPKPTIHWMKQNEPSTTDGTIEIPAEANEQFVLQVWLSQFDPKQRKVYYDPDSVEFSHWCGPIPKEVFANMGPPAEDVRQGKNRDLTTWVMKTSLPDDVYPQLEPPVEGDIRVKAWPRGSIQRDNGGINLLPGAEMLADEVHVPIVLAPVRLMAKLEEPELPIPANGSPIELVLRVYNEKDERPVKDVKISWELTPVANRSRGSLSPLSGTTDEQGLVRVTYTTPELVYYPGIDLLDRLKVFRGEGANRQDLAEIELSLAPAIELKLEAEKVKDCEYGLSGLETEPVEVRLDAETVAVEKVNGIQFELPFPMEGLETPYRVHQANIKLQQGDGKGNWKSAGGNPVKEIAPGQYTWQAPELKFAGIEEPRIYALPEDESPEAVYNEVVKGYANLYSKNRIEMSCPKEILRQDFYQKLVDYPRDVFARQLAEQPPDAICQAMSGLDLLGLASGYLSQAASIRQGLWVRFADNVSGFLKDVLSFCLNLFDVGGKLAEGARGVGRWIDQLLEGSAFKRFITWLYDAFRGKLKGFSEQLLEYFTKMTPKLNRAWKRVQISVMRQFKDAAEFIDRMVHYDVPDSTANDFVKRMTDLVSLLFKSLGHLCKLVGRLVLWLATMVW
ncbi:MAG: Ig-like domain-containing protein, partial [Anaerolineales bacterium]|nr:Ig-like domain-containing protein [Anaerolineales bacterium]